MGRGTWILSSWDLEHWTHGPVLSDRVVGSARPGTSIMGPITPRYSWMGPVSWDRGTRLVRSRERLVRSKRRHTQSMRRHDRPTLSLVDRREASSTGEKAPRRRQLGVQTCSRTGDATSHTPMAPAMANGKAPAAAHGARSPTELPCDGVRATHRRGPDGKRAEPQQGIAPEPNGLHAAPDLDDVGGRNDEASPRRDAAPAATTGHAHAAVVVDGDPRRRDLHRPRAGREAAARVAQQHEPRRADPLAGVTPQRDRLALVALHSHLVRLPRQHEPVLTFVDRGLEVFLPEQRPSIGRLDRHLAGVAGRAPGTC